jgi:hypothetical protein
MRVAAPLVLGLFAGSAFAAEVPEELKLFGYLTQAYGTSSKGSIVGTTEGGTTDLRNVAVQFRWEKSERDTVVVQLSHEQRGEDVFSPHGDEVEVDWAFYERQLGEYSELKVGRLNVPLGIYNEIRDVGTLLPFFNLPISFYAGVLSSAETVDGISIARTFAPRSEWALEAELYLGGWDTFQQRVDADSKFGIVNLEARAEDGLGVQLWLETPIKGLRFGVGTLTWLLTGPLTAPETQDRWDTYHASIDASGDRWVFRAERRRWRFDQDFGAFLGLPVSIRGKAQRDGYYVQLGAWLSPEIGIFGQFDHAGLKDNLGLLPELDDFHDDIAVSVNYRFRPDLLLKVEYHTASTRFPLGVPDLQMDVGADPVDVEWTIVGLSVSF